MDALRLDRVGYRYPGDHEALREVSLCIHRGERVALVGPNGAGKSTLLNIMSTLQLPSSGALELMGERVTKRNANHLRRHMGHVFQDPDDQIFMPSVWDDVAFGPINHGVPREEVGLRVASALQATGLEGFEERAPHHLSFGERKRVAIAGILAIDPSVLIMDEPTANLDAGSKHRLIELLQGLDKTLVIATHDLSVAFELADRVIVLRREVLFDGGFRDLVEDVDLLQEIGLELPPLPLLMSRVRERLDDDFPLPLTVDEACDVLFDRIGPGSDDV